MYNSDEIIEKIKNADRFSPNKDLPGEMRPDPQGKWISIEEFVTTGNVNVAVSGSYRASVQVCGVELLFGEPMEEFDIGDRTHEIEHALNNAFMSAYHSDSAGDIEVCDVEMVDFDIDDVEVDEY